MKKKALFIYLLFHLCAAERFEVYSISRKRVHRGQKERTLAHDTQKNSLTNGCPSKIQDNSFHAASLHSVASV